MRHVPSHLVKESLGSLGLEPPSISSILSEVWGQISNFIGDTNHLLLKSMPLVSSSPHDKAPEKKIEYIVKGDQSLPKYYNTREKFP